MELPDAGALLGNVLDRAVHEGYEHVEEEDVGEDDVADKEKIEDLRVLKGLGKFHVTHAYCELEELQYGKGEVFVGGYQTVFTRSLSSKKTPALCSISGLFRRHDKQSHHSCDRRQKAVNKQQWSTYGHKSTKMK